MTLEENISRALRLCLDGLPIAASIAETAGFRDVLSALEYFIPAVLGEIHPEWLRDEGLDGVIPVLARKTAEHDAELFGLCILIADQTLAPFHLRMQISDDCDEVNWLECRLGERGSNGMIRTPYDSPDNFSKKLYSLALLDKADAIDWVYKVTFGERRT